MSANGKDSDDIPRSPKTLTGNSDSDGKYNKDLTDSKVLISSPEGGGSEQANRKSGSKARCTTSAKKSDTNYDVIQPSFPNTYHQKENDYNNNSATQPIPLHKDIVDENKSTLYNTKQGIHDTPGKKVKWRNVTKSHERFGSASSKEASSEAYVTSCRSNVEAIGCLVLGTSLLLSGTKRTLSVVVSEGVSMIFRDALSKVFHVVQNAESFDSLDTKKSTLFKKPEFRKTLDKLSIWCLDRFKKCVYLSPDTLVNENCDELFRYEEFSAASDFRWSNTFNSGVFVYKPSFNTFRHILEFTETLDSFNGGDQGILNSFFNSWSSDISKQLPSIYNLMANVSFTHTDIHKQFFHNAKIIQFHGPFKPWHVIFSLISRQILQSSPVRLTYVQFIHQWMNIFLIHVLRRMTQKVQRYVASQEDFCAVEILHFCHLPPESVYEFSQIPSSVKLHLAKKKLINPTNLLISNAVMRKFAEFFPFTYTNDESILETTTPCQEVTGIEVDIKSIKDSSTSSSGKEESLKIQKKKVKEVSGRNIIDYQGTDMKVQGTGLGSLIETIISSQKIEEKDIVNVKKENKAEDSLKSAVRTPVYQPKDLPEKSILKSNEDFQEKLPVLKMKFQKKIKTPNISQSHRDFEGFNWRMENFFKSEIEDLPAKKETHTQHLYATASYR